MTFITSEMASNFHFDYGTPASELHSGGLASTFKPPLDGMTVFSRRAFRCPDANGAGTSEFMLRARVV